MNGRLYVQKPRNFLVQAQLLGKDAQELGSNDKEFWHWNKFEPGRQFFGSYADIAKERRAAEWPIPPDWLLETIGLGMYGPPHRYSMHASVDTLLLKEQPAENSAMPIRKAILMKRAEAKSPNPQVLAYLIVDSVTEKEVASARILETQLDRSTGCILPRRIEYHLPKMNLKLTAVLNGMKVVPEFPIEAFLRQTPKGLHFLKIP